MTTTSIGPAEQEHARPNFATALRHHLDRAHITQSALARALGIDRSMVTHWVAGRTTPSPAQVLAMEEELKVSPGLLSRWLGYVPVGEEMAAVTVEEAVEADPALTDFARRAVLAVYREVRRS